MVREFQFESGKIGIVTSTVLILLKTRKIISGHCPAAYNDAIRR